jgi:hypothetical protein
VLYPEIIVFKDDDKGILATTSVYGTRPTAMNYDCDLYNIHSYTQFCNKNCGRCGLQLAPHDHNTQSLDQENTAIALLGWNNLDFIIVMPRLE